MFLKIFFMAIAIISTCLYINNLVVDICAVMTWRTSFGTPTETIKDNSSKFAAFRFVLSIIMGIFWPLAIYL